MEEKVRKKAGFAALSGLLAALGFLPAQGAAAGTLYRLPLRHGEGNYHALPGRAALLALNRLAPLLGGPALGFRPPLGLPPGR